MIIEVQVNVSNRDKLARFKECTMLKWTCPTRQQKGQAILNKHTWAKKKKNTKQTYLAKLMWKGLGRLSKKGSAMTK